MSDLRGGNAPTGMNLGSTGKIIGAVIVAVAICGIGVYSYESGMGKAHHNQVVASNSLPSPTPSQ
ncbi:MAG TPA: hypothetical protein VII49_07160 [Rhizomicrobium sp.]